jgi:hypothetical protein
MQQVQAKVYYLVDTGEVILITSEKQGNVENTTKDEDINLFPALLDIDKNDFDVIEIEYGTLENTFNNAKSYKVNLETKLLDISYYTQEDLNAIQQQNQETQALDSRVSDILTYLSNLDSSTIDNIENSILEIEKNKIINGGI